MLRVLRRETAALPGFGIQSKEFAAARRPAGCGRHSMSLDIQERDREGIAILDLDGRLTVGNEMTKYREAMQKLIDAGKRSIVLNMQKVDYVDSTGLGALVMTYTTLQKAGGKIRLLNLTRRSIELLVMTKLTTIFEVFDDEQNAVNSFFPDREIKRFDILNFVQHMKEE
jgi:anti-sigma B factor antagonist